MQKGNNESMAIHPGTKKPEQKEKRNVGLPLIIVAGVLLLFFMGWLYQKSFSPPPILPPTGVAKTNHDYIEGLYDRTHGDYSKLTDEEIQKANQMTGGHSKAAFDGIKN